MTTDNHNSSVHFVMPFVMCGPCQSPFTTETYPMMSKTCPHSICVDCLHKNNHNNSNDNDKYFACPICHESDAFHSKHSQPNYIAVASLDLMQQSTNLLVKQSKQLVRLEKQLHSKKSSSSKKFIMNAIPAKRRVSLYNKNSPNNSNDNNNNKTKKIHNKPAGEVVPTKIRNKTSNNNSNDKDHLMMSTPPAVSGNITVPETSSEESDDGDSMSMMETVPEKKRSVVLPPPKGTERMVWVKFESGSQLAFLLSVQDDKATIRWESYKYTEVVDVDRIEELDHGNQTTGAKRRSCRGSSAASKMYQEPYGEDYDH